MSICNVNVFSFNLCLDRIKTNYTICEQSSPDLRQQLCILIVFVYKVEVWRLSKL
jgi:hypothetical protein